jgi:hypothetical protein
LYFTGLKAKLGGDNLLNLVTGEMTGEFAGFKAQKEAAIKVKSEGMVLTKLTGIITSKEIEMGETDMDMKKASLKLMLSELLFQG